MPSDVLQLTDLHLLADPDATLKGICTRDSLVAVLQFVRERCRAGEWDFDQILLTGDLAHDEKLESYEALRELLGDWVSRCRLIPGNHDDRRLIRRVFPELISSGDGFVSFSVETAGWRLIGLDSHVDGEVHGRIDKTQLQWLAAELATHMAQPTILFIHHPPVSVHSDWLDCIGLRDAEELIDVIRSFSQVRAVSAGHVHQEFSEAVDGVQMLTTPSTGVQFRPRQDVFACDPIPPGFRVFHLANTSFETSVIRLGNTCIENDSDPS